MSTIPEVAIAQTKKTDENLVNQRHSRRLDGRFTKRVHRLDRFIPQAHLRETYLTMQEDMCLKTRTSYAAVKKMAEIRGVEPRTIRRHLAELGKKLGVVEVEYRKYALLSNHTSRYTFPVLDEEFLRRRRVSGGGDTNVRVKPLLKREKQTTTTTPLPPKGGSEVEVVERVEPQRPQPSADLHRALQEAREFRAQRKAGRRAERHESARESKRSRREPSPVQKAVRHVMAILRVCPGLWATRSAIQASVERWMQERKVSADAAASALIARWKDYALLSRALEYPCGMRTWFGECRWGETSPSMVRSLRRRSGASVGSYRPPKAIDVVALREKMKALLGDFDEGPAGE